MIKCVEDWYAGKLDAVGRLAMADWCQEEGLEDLERFCRWSAETGIAPMRIFMQDEYGDPSERPENARWLVGTQANSAYNQPDSIYQKCLLPIDLYRWLEKENRTGEDNDWWRYWLSRREAEEDLGRALLRKAEFDAREVLREKSDLTA